MNSEAFNRIFVESIKKYHVKDDVNATCNNPYAPDTLEHLLYQKNWIDTVQWHLEDLIRAQGVSDAEIVRLKRWIDASNQDRTDTVEQIDDFFFLKFQDVPPQENVRLNTETPAWAIDRLSILNLKIYHMNEEANRTDASEAHIAKCQHKLKVLLQQKTDLSSAIDQLLSELMSGASRVTTYKQMKMYNDPQLNPVLRKESKAANQAS